MITDSHSLITEVAPLVGVITPLLTAIVQQPHWTPKTRRLVAVAVAVALGALTCLVNGSLNPNDLLGSIVVVLVASQATYGTLWATVAPKVEAATVVGGPKPDDEQAPPNYPEDMNGIPPILGEDMSDPPATKVVPPR